MVLVNRGWAPASWRAEHSQKHPAPQPGQKQLPPQQQLQAVDLVGLVQPDEQGNAFTPANKPDKDEFHSVQQSALVRARLDPACCRRGANARIAQHPLTADVPPNGFGHRQGRTLCTDDGRGGLRTWINGRGNS